MRLSICPSSNNLKTKRMSTPKSKGSVGKDKLNEIPGRKSLSWIDKGVKKTIVKRILSRAIKDAKKNSKMAGKKAI